MSSPEIPDFVGFNQYFNSLERFENEQQITKNFVKNSGSLINCFLHHENFMREKYKGNHLKAMILTVSEMLYFLGFDGILSSYEANQDCY